MPEQAYKRCKSCGESKPLGEYHRQSRAKDGRQGRCKACACALSSRYYHANRERASAAKKARYHSDPERYKREALEWKRANRDRHALQGKAERSRHSQKAAARSALNGAVKDGRVIKPDSCEDCGKVVDDSFVLHGHHADYSKPLEVEWLCTVCHQTRHSS